MSEDSYGNIETTRKVFTCDQCGKTFKKRGNLNVHKNVHNPNQYSCEICEKRFTYQESLKNHKKEKHGKIQTVTCEICERPFNGRRHLLTHLQTQKNSEKSFKESRSRC